MFSLLRFFRRAESRRRLMPVVECVPSPTGVICVLPTGLVRPEKFKFLTVEVPSDVERHHASDLPAQALDVYPELPTETDWGRVLPRRASEVRLAYLRALDTAAYKCAVSRGIKTPLPPRLRC